MKDSEIYAKRKRNINNLLRNIKQIWKVDFGGDLDSEQEQNLNEQIINQQNTIKQIIDGSITSITIPEGVTKIRQHIFEVSDLQNVSFPSSLKEIQGSSFAATKVVDIIIPDNCKVEHYAFDECSRLETITFEGKHKLVGACFNRCDNLQFMIFKSENPSDIDIVEYSTLNVFSGLVYADYLILVPSNSVEAYKTAWSDVADKIEAIPE